MVAEKAKLTREALEQEIAASKAAMKSHKEGVLIHEIVLKAFEAELKKCPTKTTSKEEKKSIPSSIS